MLACHVSLTRIWAWTHQHSGGFHEDSGMGITFFFGWALLESKFVLLI